MSGIIVFFVNFVFSKNGEYEEAELEEMGGGVA